MRLSEAGRNAFVTLSPEVLFEVQRSRSCKDSSEAPDEQTTASSGAKLRQPWQSCLSSRACIYNTTSAASNQTAAAGTGPSIGRGSSSRLVVAIPSLTALG